VVGYLQFTTFHKKIDINLFSRRGFLEWRIRKDNIASRKMRRVDTIYGTVPHPKKASYIYVRKLCRLFISLLKPLTAYDISKMGSCFAFKEYERSRKSFLFTSCLKLYSVWSYRLISPDPLLKAELCVPGMKSHFCGILCRNSPLVQPADSLYLQGEKNTMWNSVQKFAKHVLLHQCIGTGPNFSSRNHD